MGNQLEYGKIVTDGFLASSQIPDEAPVPPITIEQAVAEDEIARLKNRNSELERKTKEAGSGAIIYLKTGSIALSLTLGVVVNAKFDISGKIGDAISPDTNTEEVTTASVSEFRPVPPTDNFFNGIRMVFATTEDDSPAWLANPFADTYSTVVDALKVRHDVPLTTQVVHDPELGAQLPQYEYLVVIGSADPSIESLQFMPVLPTHQALAPERCWLADNGDANGHIIFEDCLEYGAADFRGQMTSTASDGGLINDDDNMLEKAEAVASIAAHNNYCTVMGVFSDAYNYWDPENRQFDLDINQISRTAVYQKFKNTYFGLLRMQAAMEYGVPVSRVLFDYEYKMLKADPSLAAGYDPLSPEYMTLLMTNTYPIENFSAAELAEFNLALDPPMLYELESSQIADIHLERMFPDIEDPQTDLRNYSVCMPASVESQSFMNDSVFAVFQHRLPGWMLNPNGFADGTSDAARAAEAPTILEGFVQS